MAIEALLLVALLTLGKVKLPQRVADLSVVNLISPARERSEAPPESIKEDRREPQPNSPEQSREAIREPAEQPLPEPVQATAESLPPDIMPLSRDQMAASDISKLATPPVAPARRRGKMGPPDTRPASDTPRVDGSGPNGEPLYAASWYREPYDSELSGYLSTASGPGWGLIACRTVADFRVDDCVGLDEYPDGSNITRAVLAAAWQFRVRPPRLGGRLQVGEWVRIRIELTPGTTRVR